MSSLSLASAPPHPNSQTPAAAGLWSSSQANLVMDKCKDDLESQRHQTCSKRCCLVACSVTTAASVTVFAVVALVVWFLLFGRMDEVAAAAEAAGRVKGDDFTALDWQRVFVASGPSDYGWGKSSHYELVGYTDNHDEYLKAMGSPKALMWMARLLVERFTIGDISDDGFITFHWKFLDIVEREWKFSLESAFTTVYGNDMGKSNKTCVQTRSNSIRCEDQHIRESEWQMTTTFDFYHLGIIRTHELPYKKNLVVKKFYEKLFNPEDVENEPYTDSGNKEDDEFWNSWNDNWR